MWLGWQPAAGMAVACAAGGLAARRASDRRVAVAGTVAREAALVLGLYAFWRLVMTFRSTRLDEGLAHGRTVFDLERWLHIGNEAAIMRWTLEHPTLVRLANDFYATVHVPALIAFLVWLFARHRDRYPLMRNTVAGLTGICLVVHWFPVAPPRMYPQLGFVDVARQYGQSVYGPVGQGISNQVSALPSLHAGWALIVAIGVLLASTSRWRWLVIAHPVLTMLVIVATANHWWLDSIAAAAIIAVVMGVQLAVARWRRRAADGAGAGAAATAGSHPEPARPGRAGAPPVGLPDGPEPVGATP